MRPWQFLGFLRHRPCPLRGTALLVVAVLATPPCTAAESSSSLGMGMHAFHGGDFEAAHRLLSEAIDSGTRDPRAYYFRGLAACRGGAGFGAEADFMEGARLEATERGDWKIGRALERVQGRDRLKLERYRAQARSMVAAEGEAAGRRVIEVLPPSSDSRLRRVRPEMEGSMRPAPVRAAAPVVEKPMLEADEPEEPAPVPDDTKADPFGDDAFGEGEPAERRASELEDGLDQQDEQAERESAAGEGGVVLEKIE